jgi:nucleoside-triphosphatase
VKRHLLLTAAPGTGKTTAIRRLAERLGDIRVAGFYTAEIRVRGERRGFRLLGFDGVEALIAHVELPKAHRVGKYGVDIGAMDRAADATLAPRAGVKLYLVDEIGKMECLSARFVEHMRHIVDGRVTLIATVASRGSGYIAEVKRDPRCELWTLSRANRDDMPAELLAWLRSGR